MTALKDLAKLWYVFLDDEGNIIQQLDPEDTCKQSQAYDLCGGCTTCLVRQAVYSKVPVFHWTEAKIVAYERNKPLRGLVPPADIVSENVVDFLPDPKEDFEWDL